MRIKLTNGRGYGVVMASDAEPEKSEGGAEKKPSSTLYLYDTIGFDFWTGGGVTAQRVIEDLEVLADEPEITVRINSPGGDVFEGAAIYNALARFPGAVNVHVDALAASAASLVAMAGTTIHVAENAMVMVHRPWTSVVGDGPEMRRTADLLDKAWTSMLATYSRRTGRRGETIEKRVADAGGEWWMSAEEAVEHHFADEVESIDVGAKAWGTRRFAHVPERLAAAGAEPGEERRRVELVELAAPRIVRASDAVGHVDQVAAARAAQERRKRIVEVLNRAALA